MNDKYILVLTHDIDSLTWKEFPLNYQRILYPFSNALIKNTYRLIFRHISGFDYLKSLRFAFFDSILSRFNLMNDPWQKSLDKIIDIERKYDVRSTLLFIPFFKDPGHTPDGNKAPINRACYYDILNHASLLQSLEQQGWEVGIHGIDAYLNLESAKRELERFKSLLPFKKKFGIRMHWLYHQGEESWKILEKAGYSYDATFGWNDKIGFPGSHYKPFIPNGCNSLHVLPLNIQDNVLLRWDRQNLNPKSAWKEAEKLLTFAKEKSAIITILWHNTSFVAPRHWGWLYEKIIQKAKEDNALIVTAGEAIEMSTNSSNS
jgi:peptidoglycan/xylan/chitin deacetylase (PgdA/CDA1 family)